MDNNTYSNRQEALENNERVNALAKLRRKLKNFVLKDSSGQFVGNVKDLIIDNNRQINLIVSQPSNNSSSQLFSITKQSIQKVDLQNKTFFVDISKSEIESLHQYAIPEAQKIQKPLGVPEGMAQITSDNPPEANAQSTNPDRGESEAVMPAQPFEAVDNQAKTDESITLDALPTTKVLEEEIIRLLGERLVVDRSRHKIGEIVVRKEIETRMVQVPVRREKLIIEQVGPEHKQIAEIDLGQEEIASPKPSEDVSTASKLDHLDGFTVSGTFNSPKTASLLLNAIALERQHGAKEVRVAILVEDASRQKTYQEWFDRCSKQQ